ncbi:MAG: PKD domain-containing protein [Bacteroidota bacterium]
MKFRIILIMTVCLLAAACQKRKYPEEQTDVTAKQIYFDGSVNGEPLVMSIGQDGYYCYSSYEQLADSAYVFEGELKKVDCNPCPLSLQVLLSDYRARAPGSAVPADSVFRTGNRNFIPAVAKPHTMKFTSFSNKPVASVRWDVSNGFSSQQPAEMNCEFGQAGAQTVSLTMRTIGNCESMVVNKIFINGTGGLFACGITAQLIQGNNSQFTSTITGGRAPYRYTWYFGDGGTGNQETVPHNYQWAGSYPVKLRVEDADNNICESNFIHVAGNDQSSCTANMSMSYVGSRNAFFNGVKIRFTDQANNILSSANIAQPAGSYFEVVKSEPFEPNEKGEAGRLLTVRFNVLVSDGSGKRWLKSDNTAIAVTYK